VFVGADRRFPGVELPYPSVQPGDYLTEPGIGPGGEAFTFRTALALSPRPTVARIGNIAAVVRPTDVPHLACR